MSDHFFGIGKGHAVCEDYAASGRTRPPVAPDIPLPSDPDWSSMTYPYAIVADGCSTGEDTDFGARLMVRAARRLIDVASRALTGGLLCALDETAWMAEDWRQSIQLPPSALYATLLAVVQNKDGMGQAVVYGDGIVAFRRRDGSGFDYAVIECSKNAPPYLGYLVQNADKNGKFPLDHFQEQGGGVRTVTFYKGNGEMDHQVEEDSWTRLGTGDEGPHDEKGITITIDPTVYDVAVVASDGLQTFQRREGTRLVPIPLHEVMAEVMAFKGTEGDFIQRRLRRFLKNAAKKGWQHVDDVSVAGIVLDLELPPEST